MRIRLRVADTQDATVPREVADALGVHDGDEVEVVNHGNTSVLQKAQRAGENCGDPGRFRLSGDSPEVISQRLLQAFAGLGDAPRESTTDVMHELRGYDEFNEAFAIRSGIDRRDQHQR